MDCLENKNDKNIPSKYKSTLSGHQGIINLEQSKHHLKSIMESRTSSGVHQWCHDTALKKKKNHIELKTKNEEAAIRIGRCVVFCTMGGAMLCDD